MAGRGPAPKEKSARRRTNAPERGEWVYLSPLERPVLGPAHRDWSPRVKRLWKAWRADPVTQQFGSADLALVWDLADQFERLIGSEQRLRMESLGLTPKGRQDRRWRMLSEKGVQADDAPAAEREQSATVVQLRVVAPEAS